MMQTMGLVVLFHGTFVAFVMLVDFHFLMFITTCYFIILFTWVSPGKQTPGHSTGSFHKNDRLMQRRVAIPVGEIFGCAKQDGIKIYQYNSFVDPYGFWSTAL